LGESLVSENGRGLDKEALGRYVDEIARLHRQGMEMIVVSSGATAEGMARLGWKNRPLEVPRLQAAAAIGQTGLMQAYETSFRRNRIHAAQVLLTHEDFANRERYLNMKATLRTLTRLRAVPVINENDTVSTERIRFGDNDMLAALVANMISAERLVILIGGTDLRSSATCGLVDTGISSAAWADNNEPLAATAGSKWSLGMLNEMKAAKMFGLSGGVTTIASGHTANVLESVRAGLAIGIELLPGQNRLLKRKQWLAGHQITHGALVLDAGAAHAIERCGGSILAIGVTDVRGDFARNEMIQIQDFNERPVAQGLSNYSAREMIRMVRKAASTQSSDLRIQSVEELVHRRNIVLKFL
jgi:glutamate 5-kinase